VTSAKGLKEVAIYDGDELFRRFLPNGQRTFEWQSDLTHNQQHNLFVVATDVDGAQTVTTELWDRIHLFEEYMCYDRMNQLPWGQARWEDTRTQARIIPPTPATAVKGPWSSYMVSSPAGLYSTDARSLSQTNSFTSSHRWPGCGGDCGFGCDRQAGHESNSVQPYR
jgi:hypothetical protein